MTRPTRAARTIAMVLLAALVLGASSCTGAVKEKVKATISSGVSPSIMLPTASPRPSRPSATPSIGLPSRSPSVSETPEASASPNPPPSPSETSKPTAKPSRTQTPSPSPTKSPKPPSSPTSKPTGSPTPSLSPTPAPTVAVPSITSPPTTPTASSSSSGWIWALVVIALVLAGVVLALILRARARAGRLAGWRSNAFAPYAQALALRGRLAALLEGPGFAVAQIRETLPELDRIAGSLDQLAIDVPDPSAEQTLRALVSSLAALRSSLEVLVAAAGGAAQQAATASARERLADLETSLSAFREAARPQPPAGSAS